jgi:hypothetical protein
MEGTLADVDPEDRPAFCPLATTTVFPRLHGSS